MEDSSLDPEGDSSLDPEVGHLLVVPVCGVGAEEFLNLPAQVPEGDAPHRGDFGPQLLHGGFLAV